MFELLLIKKTANAASGKFALFAGGENAVLLSDKYYYNSDASASGKALRSRKMDLAGTGNADVGLFSGGFSGVTNGYTSHIEKYNYSSDTIALTTNLSKLNYKHTAAGNSTVGCFFGGYDTVNYIGFAITDRYNYSDSSRVSGASLIQKRTLSCSIGTSEFAVIAGGSYSVTTTEKYDYGNNTRIASAALSPGVNNVASASGVEVGIIAASESTPSRKYTFSSNTFVGGTQLNIIRSWLAATSNPEIGYFGGGYVPGSGYMYSVEKYFFSNDTVSIGGNLVNYKIQHAGTSTTPSWS